ncbi:hypothetical protein EMCRGX_G000634 [Ephydatia muelleri]
MELHRDQLQKRCRVFGSLLVAKGKKRRAFYQCSEFKDCLFRAFINNDLPDIHPVSLCYSCKQIMDRPMTCYSSTAITEWEVHAEDRFMVCYPKRGTKPTPPTTADIIIATIKGIAPPHHPPDMPLSTLNNSAILDQLQCLICLKLLCQPLELPCRALVCTTCMVRWFEVFSCSNVKCPFVDAPLLPSALKPAPPIIMVLLQDIHVECSSCKKNIRIGDYNIHDCDAKPTKDEVKMASQVLSKLAATSPDKTISIPTDGLIMAKGETSVLLRNELDYLDSAERELLLKQAGIISHIGATQALALKAGIGMPWTALAGQEGA